MNQDELKIQSDAEQRISSETLKVVFYTILFNSIIALLLTLLEFGHGFLNTFIFSQCIGLTICICVKIMLRMSEAHGKTLRFILLCIALFIGAVTGTLIGSFITGSPEKAYSLTNLLQVVGFSMIFGLVIGYFFYSRERLAESIQMAQQERIKRLSSDKQVLEADLKRLQAQMEPHFLFNTLSNIVSLMESDAGKAKVMLMNLIQYLRNALSRTRESRTTLGKEMELIQAYLDIFKIRMGDRLCYRIDLPEMLKETVWVPMLLQPVVENALLHGLEPKIDGGEINIRVHAESELLKVEVADTGQGMTTHIHSGFGLNNIKVRLRQLYGKKGRLIIEENYPCGLVVTLQVPLPYEKKAGNML